MKKYLLDEIYNMTRMMVFIMVLQFISASLLLAENSNAQSKSVYEIEMNLVVDNEKVFDIIKDLEARTNFEFTYNSKSFKRNEEISFEVKDGNLGVILEKISSLSDLNFRRVNNNIHVYHRNKEAPGFIEERIDQSLQSDITGIVTDENGEPLPGATILEVGTTNGTVTDVDGNFSMIVVGEHSKLLISFVGYTQTEVVVGSQSNISIQLKPDYASLDEVVVIGYGSQKKVNLTGAVSSVDFEDKSVSNRAISNISSALAGMTSGISVMQSSGIPSANGASISVRGVGSLNASQNPLIVVDGQPIGDINSISPNDVATISVLKDAASSAIYGSRASNGVILITTKSGKNTDGKLSFNYSNVIGMGKPQQTQKIISNTADHMSLINLAQENSGLLPQYTQTQIDDWRELSKTDPIGYPNTDWWDALIKDNVRVNHNFSVQGGNDKTKFYTSVSYFSDNGIVPNTKFHRINFRNNLTYKVNNWLELGNNLELRTSKYDVATENGIFTFWRATTPGMVPKLADGRYGGAQTPAGEAGANNPLRSAETAVGENTRNEYLAKIYATLTPVKGVSITARYFTEVRFHENWSSGRTDPMWDFRNEVIVRSFDPRLSISSAYDKNQRHVVDLFGSYDISIAKNHFRLLAGYNQEYYKSNNLNGNKSDLLSLQTPVLAAAPSDPNVNGNASDWAIRSYFGRFNYDLDNKYLLEANVRYDGSSKFSPENRWGLFPSFSAGWRISEEAFWEPLNNTINNFKIRGSWGRLGNNGIGNYEWQSVYSGTNHSFNSTVVPGLAYNSISNSGITWETTDILNIGADFNVRDNFSVNLNYYNKNTTGLLANIPIPTVFRSLTAPRVNSAEVNNSGFETEIRYENNFGEFFLSVSGNVSFNKNKIVKYKEDFIEPRGSYQAWAEGYPIGVYWIREVDHIVQDQSEIDALVADGYTFNPSAPGPGDFLYKNTDGDTAITNGDRVLKGNPIPLANFGADMTMKFKGFDLYVLMSGVAGWDRYLQGFLYETNRVIVGYLAPEEYLNSWTSDNPNTDIPKLYTNNEKNDQASDYFLHDASFVRIKTIQLGYTIPSKITDRARINNLRIYANLENYLTFTSFPGQDPENGDVSNSIDATYPLTKVASLGINVSF